MTGWTVTTGSASSVSGGIQGSVNGATIGLSATMTVPARRYLYFKIDRNATTTTLLASLTINGEASSAATWFKTNAAEQFVIVPVPTALQGSLLSLAFSVNAPDGGTPPRLSSLWTIDYPNTPVSGEARPGGIDVIYPGGSARAGFRVEFTAPAGGAWLLTCPDPDYSLRVRGAAEMQWTATATGDPFPDDYRIDTTPTTTQPIDLHPNGAWPQTTFGTQSYGYPTSFVPGDSAVTWFSTSGDKAVVSASALLPEGYHADAIAHEEHVLHPGECGFTLLDEDGAPIPCTITYKRHWKHLAA
jgi:hypothetical protein